LKEKSGCVVVVVVAFGFGLVVAALGLVVVENDF